MTTALLDVGVLYAAHDLDHEAHKVCKGFLDDTPSFATCSITETGLLRLLMNPLAGGLSAVLAVVTLSDLRALESHAYWNDDVTLAHPYIDTTRLQGYRQITDYHLLNLAVFRGGKFATLEKRFADSLTVADRRHVVVLSA